MGKGILEVSYPGVFLFASSGQLQAQVERLVGPLSERRCLKDRRRSKRDIHGRRESERGQSPGRFFN
jgi:hypothetical protein